jgi:DNA-binding response OmpR family regulator
VIGQVLVVDDDDVGRKTLAEILRLEGFEVEEASGGREAIRRLSEVAYDVMLLDLKMPDVDGLAVLEVSARDAPETQVIVFTAHGSLESAIQAVRHGAYDYVLKPTSSREILASVRRAIERRQNQHREQEEAVRKAQAPAAVEEEGLHGGEEQVILGGIRLEVERRRLLGRERSVELTPAEMRLLLALWGRQGHLVGYRELVERVQGYRVESWEAAAMVRPVVSRLRRKLLLVGASPGWIVTVRGAGYLLAEGGD